MLGEVCASCQPDVLARNSRCTRRPSRRATPRRRRRPRRRARRKQRAISETKSTLPTDMRVLILFGFSRFPTDVSTTYVRCVDTLCNYTMPHAQTDACNHHHYTWERDQVFDILITCVMFVGTPCNLTLPKQVHISSVIKHGGGINYSML